MLSRAAFAVAAMAVVVVPIALLLPIDPIVRWALLGLAAVSLVGGIALGLSLRRREQPVTVVPVAPAIVPDTLARPWPRDAFAAALAHALAATPFRVHAADDRLRILVDERDPRYVGSVQHWRPAVVLHWDLMLARDAVAIRTGMDGLEWAEPGLPPRRTGRAAAVTPRVVAMLEAEHAREVRAPHPWRWIADDVRPVVEATAARAGWSAR